MSSQMNRFIYVMLRSPFSILFANYCLMPLSIEYDNLLVNLSSNSISMPNVIAHCMDKRLVFKVSLDKDCCYSSVLQFSNCCMKNLNLELMLFPRPISSLCFIWYSLPHCIFSDIPSELRLKNVPFVDPLSIIQ